MFKCDLCGREFEDGGIFEPEFELLSCPNCRELLGGCAMCDNSKVCAARENKDGLPPIKQIKTENGFFQGPNPDIIPHYCTPEKCKCAHENNFCMRQLNKCGNFHSEEILALIKSQI